MLLFNKAVTLISIFLNNVNMILEASLVQFRCLVENTRNARVSIFDTGDCDTEVISMWRDFCLKF